jgi:3-dehydroquinate synthase
MQKITYTFSNTSSHIYFDYSFNYLKKIVNTKNGVIITDETIFSAHSAKFKGYNTIVVKSGEKYKTQQTCNQIINQLLQLEADRNVVLIGVGGGVITDLTGYIASIYKRGVKFGFIPTSILAMVDACLGGKNGINVGLYKNIVGCINQPNFILYDFSFLNSLPKNQWQQGFAEIIKHACISNHAMFKALQKNNLEFYIKNKLSLKKLIKQNIQLKLKVVLSDEFEKDKRKILNFGHTLAHAIENVYSIHHGFAVAIGIAVACNISNQLNGFKQTQPVMALLLKYELLQNSSFDMNKIISVLKSDKKRDGNFIHYILLEKIGKAVITPISFKKLETILIKL